MSVERARMCPTAQRSSSHSLGLPLLSSSLSVDSTTSFLGSQHIGRLWIPLYLALVEIEVVSFRSEGLKTFFFFWLAILLPL